MRAQLGLICVALVLAACGSDANTSDSQSPDVAESTAAVASAKFGDPIELAPGISVSVAAPVAFKPGDFASNFLPGQTAELFTIAVKNTSTAAFDLSTVLFSATSAGNYCTDVLDGDNGISGAPSDPVPAGGSVTFKFAAACDAKPGGALELSVAFGDTEVLLEGKLA